MANGKLKDFAPRWVNIYGLVAAVFMLTALGLKYLSDVPVADWVVGFGHLFFAGFWFAIIYYSRNPVNRPHDH